MSGSFNSQSNPGLFIPSTYIWGLSQLQNSPGVTPELKELLVRLYQNINSISIALNLKDSGYYVQQEFLNSQLFFPNPLLDSTTPQTPTYRQVFRMVIDFGALPNAGTKSVAHNIEVVDNYSFTRIYGAATTPTSAFIPLPYASPTLNLNIQLDVSATDVTITTGVDYSAYTLTYIILEYIKQ